MAFLVDVFFLSIYIYIYIYKKIQKKIVLRTNPYGVWVTASGARRERDARPVPWNGPKRRLVQLTEG